MRHGLDFSLEELCGRLSNSRLASSCTGPFDHVNLSNKGHMGFIDANLRPAQTVPGPRPAERMFYHTSNALAYPSEKRQVSTSRGSREWVVS